MLMALIFGRIEQSVQSFTPASLTFSLFSLVTSGFRTLFDMEMTDVLM